MLLVGVLRIEEQKLTPAGERSQPRGGQALLAQLAYL
jgi:hypothetical protein